jgi:hypothetical protein
LRNIELLQRTQINGNTFLDVRSSAEGHVTAALYSELAIGQTGQGLDCVCDIAIGQRSEHAARCNHCFLL